MTNEERAREWFESLLHAEEACQGNLSVDYATDLATRAIASAVKAKGEADADWLRANGKPIAAEDIRAHAADIPPSPVDVATSQPVPPDQAKAAGGKSGGGGPSSER